MSEASEAEASVDIPPAAALDRAVRARDFRPGRGQAGEPPEVAERRRAARAAAVAARGADAEPPPPPPPRSA